MKEDYNLSEKIVDYSPTDKEIPVEDIKEFLKIDEDIIQEEIRRTDGSYRLNMSNLFERIQGRRLKSIGYDLK